MTYPNEVITALVSANPIPSMPSTEIIDETLNSLRAHLPTARIVVLCDGVRDDDSDLADAYEDWAWRLIDRSLCDPNMEVVRFSTWVHQAAMYADALTTVDTPLVLMVEADTPLTDPEVGPIPWEDIADVLRADRLDLCRFAHEATILHDHEYLMVDREPVEIGRVPVIRTVQFSARPHLARADWYRRVLSSPPFNEDTRSFVEDLAYGVVQAAWHSLGMKGWEEYRMAIYAPDGSYVRSRHLDGRDGREKAPVIR